MREPRRMRRAPGAHDSPAPAAASIAAPTATGAPIPLLEDEKVIRIATSPTADTRTCDFASVTREQLLESSRQHIEDVRVGLHFFAQMLYRAGMMHDVDKVTDIDGFHDDFVEGMKPPFTSWLERHYSLNRHHLAAEGGVPNDVNLIDVLDYITDCVMAAKARSGELGRMIEIDPKVLERAFDNTVRILNTAVVVENPPVDGPELMALER